MLIRYARLATVALLLLAPAAQAADRDLFRIDTILGPVQISEGGNDVVSLIDDFLDQSGAFGGLIGLVGYRGTLDYAGIPNAILFNAQNSGREVTIFLPITGTLRTFIGATPDEVSEQMEDWLKGSGVGEWADFLRAANGLSPLALLSGNPRSTVALMGSGPYRRFGFDDSRSRMGFGEPVKRWGSFELRVDAGLHSVNTAQFSEDLWTLDPTVTLAGDFGRTVGLSFSIMGQYRDYNGAQQADLGLELALPLTLRRPDENESPWYWQLTPFVQAAGAASIDFAAGGLLMGGGLVSGLGYHMGDNEITLSNEIAYYGGIPIDDISGYDFDTELSQLYFKNGLEGTWWMGGGFYADAGIHFTNFALDDAAVSWYATPTVGLGWQAGRWMDIRIAYEGDLSTESYRSHGAQLKLDFLF